MNESPPPRLSLPLVALFACLALAVVYGAQVAARRAAPVAAPPAAGLAERVVLIVLDALRPDHMSLYGYPRPTTPNLDRLAAGAAVFTTAYAPAPMPLPSHASLATGLLPMAHGVRYHVHSLAESHITLAEVLRGIGFVTAAFTDGGALHRDFGLSQGFQVYQDHPDAVMGLRRQVPVAAEWLFRRQRDRFFLTVQSRDMQAPYSADPASRAALSGGMPVLPEGASLRPDPLQYLGQLGIHNYLRLERYPSFAAFVDDYDAMIRTADAEVGNLIGRLEALGLFEDALIVVTAAHGESFLDHGVYAGHGLFLTEEEVRVPLLVKFPRGRFAGTRSDAVVRLIDVLPTVAAAAGAAVPAAVQGRDLAAILDGSEAEPRPAFLVAPNLAAPGVDGLPGLTTGVRLGPWKLVEPPRIEFGDLARTHLRAEGAGGATYDDAADPLAIRPRVAFEVQLFDVSADAREQVDLSAGAAERTAELRARIAAQEQANFAIAEVHRIARRAQPERTDEQRRLRELGY